MDSSIDSIDMGGSTSSAGAICAPLEALQINGTPPSVGDNVEMNVKGTVTSIEGEMVYVQPEAVNDISMPVNSGQEMDEGDLRVNAQNYDQQGY